jgi:glutamate synthase (NADPH) small chain
MEYKRKDPGYRPIDERLRDYRAVELQLSQDETRRQASRCMDCGIPFCHAYGCPVSNVIPELNAFVCRGNWRQAMDLLLSADNFPEFTGRVCPAPCEGACVAGISDDPVTIRQIELAIIERGFESGDVGSGPPSMRYDNGVAVIGSGPAGLAVADTLNRAGYRVTVYDNARHPGGILRYGIPDFKLEKWVVERRVKLMENEGVVFEMGVSVGEDISYRYLKKRFDAVCLAGGSREPRDLKIPGRELNGIHFAMDYLTQQNKRIGGEPVDPSKSVTATGKTVIVIGGGDTGSDCLGTALRQGAKKVYQFEILPKPPVKRSQSTPWPMWPLMLRKTHAHKEGGDQRWSVMTEKFSGHGGVLKKLHCAEVEWVKNDEDTPGVPVKRARTDFEVDADLVILATGFMGPGRNRLVEELEVALDNRGNVKADERHMTNVEGLFVSGDMHQGQTLIVRAISDGRKAAYGIMKYLRKK